MIYITLFLTIFATVNGRLIGNDPKTWSPTKDTWAPIVSKFTPIHNKSLIVSDINNIKNNIKNNIDSHDNHNSFDKIDLLDAVDAVDAVDDMEKIRITVINFRDDETLPKFISDILDWFRFNNTQVKYTNRRLLL
jgi:hypothetical protein